MNSTEFLEELLKEYSSTFDIYRDYEYNGEVYPAYAQFYSHNEKYVLVREAKLWEANCFEHTLFIKADKLDEKDVKDIQKLIKDNMEPDMVRKGERLPVKNHMYTYLTVVVLCEGEISSKAVKMIKRFSFGKSYQLTIRGWSNAKLVCVDLKNQMFISNREGKALKKLITHIFKKCTVEEKIQQSA